ncbi:hypothetical protein [Pseudomonas sp. IT-P218]|uniref:hypothetical protein n=1 Tax=Pseudomonas sp. IT-P218 TaxID=3026449 RepID=UPI0039E063C3
MTYETVTDVTVDDLYRALARFGTLQAAEMGYFHALTGTDSNPILFRITVPVVGDVEAPNGPTYARGTISYADKGLTTPPKLLGVVEGVSPDHTSSFNLTNITATSCDYTVRQNSTSASVNPLPLNGSFTIIALS